MTGWTVAQVAAGGAVGASARYMTGVAVMRAFGPGFPLGTLLCIRTPNFGRKSLNEIKEVLSGMGLHLGMDVEDWPPENIEDLAKKYEDQF